MSVHIGAFRIPQELKARVTKYCAERQVALSTVFRVALSEYLDRQEQSVTPGDEVLRFLEDPRTPNRISNVTESIRALGNALKRHR